MILAQAQEVATEIGKQLDKATEWGFAPYLVILIFFALCAYKFAHFWWIEKPESISSQATQKEVAACMTKLTASYGDLADFAKSLHLNCPMLQMANDGGGHKMFTLLSQDELVKLKVPNEQSEPRITKQRAGV